MIKNTSWGYKFLSLKIDFELVSDGEFYPRKKSVLRSNQSKFRL